jgi:Ferritin-like domain
MKSARTMELAGIGAFAGAHQLIENLSVSTFADSILASEARHQAILNIFNGGSPSPQPFDIPLLPEEVLAMAGGLISGCDLGAKGAPSRARLVVNGYPLTFFFIFFFAS